MISLKNIYLLASGLALFLCGYLFYPSAATLDNRWSTNQESYSHGYYLLIAAVLLALRQWRSIKLLPVTPYPLASLPLALCSLAWLAAHIGNIQVGEQLMLPAIALSLVFLLAGKAIGKLLVFPFLLIYTVIPVWDVLNPVLQYLTTQVSSSLLALYGVPVFIEGNYISIPAGNFVVASGCSGLNYLLMCVFISLVYNHLYLHSLKRQLCMLAAGILAGIVCNWIRVTTIIAIGEITNMQSPMIRDHENLGLVLFGIFTIPLMFFGRYLEDGQTKETTHPDTSVSHSRISWLAWPAMAVTIMLFANLWHNNSSNDINPQAAAVIVKKDLAKLKLIPSSPPLWGPNIEGADIHLNYQQLAQQPLGQLSDQQLSQQPDQQPSKQQGPQLSTENQPALSVTISGFLFEVQGKELIHDNNKLHSSSWVKTSSSAKLTALNKPVQLITLKDQRSNQQALVLYTYLIGDRIINNTRWVKPSQIHQSLLHHGGATLITVSLLCNGECSDSNDQPLLTLADRLIDSYSLSLHEALNQ